MFQLLKKEYILLLKKIDLGSAIAVRLTKYTGKSKEFMHPKHFLTQKPWYISYLKKTDIVLDLGSGNGQSAIKSAKYVKKVVGLEIDDELIEIARKSANIKNINFKKANLEEKLSLQSKSFEKVIFLDVLEHLRNRDQILEEIRRILKLKGLLLLGVPNSQSSWKKLQRSVGVNSFSDPDHKVEFSEKGIKNLLKKHGFEIEEFSYAPADTPLRGLIDVVGSFSLTLYKKISQIRKNAAMNCHHEASGFEIVARAR